MAPTSQTRAYSESNLIVQRAVVLIVTLAAIVHGVQGATDQNNDNKLPAVSSCCRKGSFLCSPSSCSQRSYCCSKGTTCADHGQCQKLTKGSATVGGSCREDTNLTITVDNFLNELFFDGVQVPPSELPNGNSDQWRVPDTVSLPGTVKLIAVKVTNENVGYAGVLASDGLGSVLTNSSWKCLQDSSVSSDQWMMPSYSDSAWPSAISNAGNIPSSWPWVIIPGIAANAQWIWTTTMPSSELTIYCRLTVQEACCP